MCLIKLINDNYTSVSRQNLPLLKHYFLFKVVYLWYICLIRKTRRDKARKAQTSAILIHELTIFYINFHEKEHTK